MKLNLGRIGPYLSDRLVVNQADDGGLVLSSKNSLWDWCLRVISWVYSPAGYSDENRRTVSCFKKYLINQLGSDRLARVCSRYGVVLDTSGSPLLSRDVAKIRIGIEDVTVEDIEDIIIASKDDATCPEWIQKDLTLRSILQKATCSENLSQGDFAFVYNALQRPLAAEVSVPHIRKIGAGKPTEFFARFKFDRFLATRERLILQKHKCSDFETFAHQFTVRVMRRELDVGMLVPAPDSKEGSPQFYRVDGKLVTGKGMVSYWLVPATKKTDLEAVRFDRGTAPRPGEIDSSSSIMTDFELNIGETAWNSGKPYAPLIKKYLPVTPKIAGHSLGSTLAQSELVENPDIREAYLFNGPGVSDSQVEAFNARMRDPKSLPVRLVIRNTRGDVCSEVGSAHLGYQAPQDKVKIDYREYIPRKGFRGSLHTTVWGLGKHPHQVENVHSSDALHYKRLKKLHPKTVRMREIFGPSLSKMARGIQHAYRRLFSARALELKGLHVGRFENGGRWTVRHLQPS